MTNSSILHSSPLNLIVNPEILSGLPGERLELTVVVQNLGEQSATIDLFLEADTAILQWCRSTRQQLGLDSQQSHQVIFEIDLPSNALPGSFTYSVVLDAPNHYPNDTPIQVEHRLQVQSKEQTAVGIYDPTFFLKPATNSQHPAKLQPGEILIFEVQVENRFPEVDEFRLISEDVEQDWLTVCYPSIDRKTPGRIQEETALNLNPNERGTIRLEVHPPIDALAGLYSPALRLHSKKQPDLKRLDFIYIDIKMIEVCQIELETILDRVSYRSGEYQIRLANLGNLFRHLSFSASSREEEESLTYSFAPDQLRLPPGREAQVHLNAMPLQKRRRPWFRARTFPFQIKLQDAQGYQLPDQHLQAALVWQARPWWQLVLGALLALGLLSGFAGLIWWLFFKPPAPVIVEAFKANSLEYTEGDSVNLSWRIQNPQRIQALTLNTQMQDADPEAKPIQPKTFAFTDATPPANLPDTCPEPEQLCQQYEVGKLAAGRYEFDLQPSDRSNNNNLPPSKLTVLVTAKPDPQVTKFEPVQSEYQSGASVGLNWTIENVSQLAALTLTATDQSSNRTRQAAYRFNQGIPKALQSVCQRQGEKLTCAKVTMPGLKSGLYKFDLQITTAKGKALASTATPTVSIKPSPLRIASFVVNGHTDGGNLKLQLNQSLKISWQVEGGEGEMKVNIAPYGSFPATGSQDFGKFAAVGNYPVQITATDAAGQEVSGAGFLVTVIALPSPRAPILRKR